MHARSSLVLLTLIGSLALAQPAAGRSAKASLQAKLRSFAPSSGKVTLAMIPSGVWPMPAARLSLDVRGQLRFKQGHGREQRISFAQALQVLPRGWLARSLARLSERQGRQLQQGQLQQLQDLEQQVRRDNLRGLLAGLGVSSSRLANDKLDRLLGSNLRLAKKQDGTPRVAQISVAERVRSTPYKVLQLDGSGSLVTYGINDVQVGEERTSVPRAVSPAEAGRQFSGLDLRQAFERALR
jgi:hypothetical protein